MTSDQLLNAPETGSLLPLCTADVFWSVTILGLALITTAIILLFFRKLIQKKIWIPLFILLLLFGLLTLFSASPEVCQSGPAVLHFDGIRLFPDWF